jgi:TniQ
MIEEILAELNLPPRSRLIGPEPAGIGTPEVECLPSYLHRVADVHHVRLYRLVAELLPEFHRAGREKHLVANWTNDQVYLAAQFNKLTQRTNLQHLTLQIFAPILSPCGLYSPFRRWCPKCIAEDRFYYQPLYWNLKTVSACYHHRYPLQDTCPSCSYRTRLWGEACAAPTCPKCRSHLTGGSRIDEPSDWECWKAEQCALLMAHTGPSAAEPTPLADIMEKVLFRTHGDKASAARAMGVKTSFVYQAGHLSQRTTLEILLRLAYACSLEVTDLLYGSPSSVAAKPRNVPSRLHKTRHRFHPSQLRSSVIGLRRLYPQMAAAQVAARLHVSSTTLKTKCPEEYGEMLANRLTRLQS